MVNQLKVIQCNVGRSKEAHYSAIDIAVAQQATIICIQEPSTFSFSHTAISTLQHSLYFSIFSSICTFPSSPHNSASNARPRTVTYISKSAPNYDVISLDVDMVITRHHTHPSFTLTNIYNERQYRQNQAPIYTAERLLFNTRPTGPSILVGDLNLHHNWWNPIISSTTSRSHALVNWLTSHRFSLSIDSDVIDTYGGTFLRQGLTQQSVLDLAFEAGFQHTAITDWSYSKQQPHSDHRLIQFNINSQLVTPLYSQPRFNLNKMKWGAFRKDIRKSIAPIHTLLDTAHTDHDFDHITSQLTHTITLALHANAPPVRQSSRSKPWWTPELRSMRTIASRLQRQAAKSPNNASLWRQYKSARNHYFRAIQHAKDTHWTNFLQNIHGKDIFTAVRIATRSIQDSIPNLSYNQGIATTFNEKAQALFSKLHAQSTSTPQPPLSLNTTHLSHTWDWPPLTVQELEVAVQKTSNISAPGPDGISYKPIKEAYSAIPTFFFQFYNALFTRGYHPTAWKVATGIVFRKKGKPDYTDPKAYRVISLLNCLGKILDKLFANRLSYLANTGPLLDESQYGGRKQRSALDAGLQLQHFIQQSWQEGKKLVSVAFYDFQGAFDRIQTTTLLQICRHLNLPANLQSWIKSALTGRSLQLFFNGQTSTSQLLSIGAPQGSPISPLLFLLYTRGIQLSPLLQVTLQSCLLQLSFIDDFAIAVAGTSERKIAKTQSAAASALYSMAAELGSTFESLKTDYIVFSRRRTAATICLALPDGSKIHPSSEVKWLGFLWTPTLTWHQHASYRLHLAHRAWDSIRRLYKHLPFQAGRHALQAYILPVALYGSQLWWGKNTKDVSSLESLQQHCLRAALRAWPGAWGKALECEAGILPIPTRLELNAQLFGLRTLTFNNNHPHMRTLYQQSCDELTGDLPPISTILRAAPSSTQLLRLLTFKRPQGQAASTLAGWVPPWQPNFPGTITISNNSKENTSKMIKAQLHKGSLKHTLRLFTDGSLLSTPPIPAKVATAAFLLQYRNIDIRRSYNLGHQVEVFDAELIAIGIGLSHTYRLLSKNTHLQPSKLLIFVDNQAAIYRLRQHYGHPNARQAFNTAQEIKRLRPTMHLEVIWCPSHCGIYGNEIADQLAKAAAKQKPSTQPASLAYLRREARLDAIIHWRQSLATSKHGQNTYLAVGVPTLRNKTPKDSIYNASTISQFIQLRTGAGYIKSRLFKMGKELSPACSCGAHIQTAQHLLLFCPHYTTERKELETHCKQSKLPLNMQSLFLTTYGRQHLTNFLLQTKICTYEWFISQSNISNT